MGSYIKSETMCSLSIHWDIRRGHTFCPAIRSMTAVAPPCGLLPTIGATGTGAAGLQGVKAGLMLLEV